MDDGKNVVLKEISVVGKVIGNFLLNEVTQIFTNGSEESVEFIYTFPMPESASVSSFKASTKENSFAGTVKSKKESLEVYQTAISKGDSAYMLESHRDNIFQVSLGHVAKDEEITVNISYIQDIFHKTMSDNSFRLLIPTLVSPRYIPGRPIGQGKGTGILPPTDKVPDADFITPHQGETGYKASFKIDFELDSTIREITSPSHEIVVNFDGGNGRVTVDQADLDSDFVLNVSMYGVYNEKFIISDKLNDEYFSYVSFIPKLKLESESSGGNTGKEYIFLIDVSGSMMGANLESAKKAMKICLNNMEPGDIFNIIAFESYFECFSKKSVEFNEETFTNAGQWIDSLVDRGGTEIFKALQYAIKNSRKTRGEAEKIIMLITDGQIGNEDEIIKYVKNNFDGRIFCVGIDVNVNDSFLNKISTVGNGFTEFYYPGGNEDLVKKVVKQFIRSNSAYLKDIRLETGSMYESAGKLPEYIYNNECYNFISKTDKPVETLSIIGFDGTKEVRLNVQATATDEEAALLSKMWAKKKISEMEMNLFEINPRHKDIAESQIIDISVRYGVICRYTSFIAVNLREDKQKGLPKAAVVPINVPKTNEDEPDSGMRFRRSINRSRGIAGGDVLSQSEMDSLLCQLSGPVAAPSPRVSLKEGITNFIDNISQRIGSAYTSEEEEDATLVVEDLLIESFTPELTFEDDKEDFDSDDFDPEDLANKVFEDYSTNVANPSSLIKETYAIAKMGNPISVDKFNDFVRANILKIADDCNNTIIQRYFIEIDHLLSSVEVFANDAKLNDTEFSDCFKKLIGKLEENFPTDSDLSEIASKQNFDGSFLHCNELKINFSLIILKRFLTEGDSYVYGKQIKKLFGYFDKIKSNLTEQQKIKLAECEEMANNVL